jgi:TonB-linked SusC/RagA family outer membrane protein
MIYSFLRCSKFWPVFPVIALLLAGVTASAQTVSGIVQSATDNQPLAGVTVHVSGKEQGTVTNEKGYYRLSNVSPGDSLFFSYIGFEKRTVLVGNRTQVNIRLTPTASSLNQVVVIGYGSVKKIDLTGSVGTANVKDMQKAPVASFAEALAGRVAGVQVNSVDGQPGGGINIMIRGAGSLTQSTAPLYVVDGFPIEDLDPSTINPEEIESISILKDASSTAIYGSRGANGVVLIQTKRGKPGKAVVTLDGSVGYQIPPKPIPMMSPYEFVKYQQELDPLAWGTPLYFSDGKTLDDYKNVKGINWQDQVLQPGIIQIYDLAIRGGTDETRYSISGSMFDQKGVIINTGLSRYSGRVTLDQNISPKMKAGVTVDYTETNTYGQQIRSIYGGGNATSTALIRAWMYRPISADPNEDLLTEEGDESLITTSDFRINPVIDLENQYQHTIKDIIQGNGYVSYDITKNLTFKSTIGIMQIKSRNEQFYNSKTSQGSPLNPANKNGVWGALAYTNSNSFFNENTLNFNKTFQGGHTISGLLLFGVNSYKTFYTGFTGTQLPNEIKRMDGLDESPSGTLDNPSIYNTVNTMASYAARIDYNYKSKYLLTINFRADGSSKFLDHWGYFPGGAIAWNMDQEDFFKDAFPFISNSKIRVSYGENGNNRVGDFDSYPKLTLNNTGQGYSFDNQPPTPGAYLSTLGNSKLRWEKTKQTDIGYEFGVLDNRIALEVDLYRRTTENLLLNAQLPPSSGFGSAQENIGKLRNDGIEITLNTLNVSSGSFSWRSSFNISFNRNKIIELAYGQPSLSSTVTYLSQFGQPLYLDEIGKPIGMMIGYIWEGNYQYSDFDNPSPGVYVLKNTVPDNGTTRSTIQPGDIKLKDLNGDGTVNSSDMTIIGRGQPIHIGGFSNDFTYKNFTLNLFFQWSYGNNIYNANRLLLEGNSNKFHGINQYASYENRWTPDNPTNENYRTGGQGFIGYFSSKNVEDGSYLRLKTLSLAYSLPTNMIKKLYLSNLTIDVSAQNLITLTHYSGLDPEVSTANNVLQPGYDFSAYPNARTIVVGLKASF